MNQEFELIAKTFQGLDWEPRTSKSDGAWYRLPETKP